ncbi:hypothetical protein AOLI_G00149940 [Acnodon oligacanthus]
MLEELQQVSLDTDLLTSSSNKPDSSEDLDELEQVEQERQVEQSQRRAAAQKRGLTQAVQLNIRVHDAKSVKNGRKGEQARKGSVRLERRLHASAWESWKSQSFPAVEPKRAATWNTAQTKTG